MFKPGEIVDGKYEILGKVAEGGMGEVYRARHLHLDDVRIIKVMKTLGGDDATSQRRFSEEARLATQVRHPNVAALYDFSKLPSGSYYMVWEFIDGETLLHRLRRVGRLSPEEAIDIGIQVLSGLGEIHRTRVVHRDVSPDNIMIVVRDGRRVAKIIDLGIAKRIAQDRLGMTATGMFLGKLKYCSPEQAGAAGGETLDGRSDLYSFGAVLYEMLSGKPLFESPTPEGYIVKHLQEAPPVLLRDDLPRETGFRLSEIVDRALRKDRDRRFQTAAEFSAALAALLPVTATMPTVRSAAGDHDPTLPLETPPAGTTVVRPRRDGARSRALGAAAAFFLFGALVIGYAWRSARREALPPAVSAPAVPPPPSAKPSTPPAPAIEIAAPPRIVEAPGPAAPVPKARRAPATPPESAPVPAPPKPPAPPDESAAIARFEQLRETAEKGSLRDVDAFVDFVATYLSANPGTAFTGSLRSLPERLRARGDKAYASGHPWRALRIYQICSRLPSAPNDPEFAERLTELRARLQGRRQMLRRESPPPG